MNQKSTFLSFLLLLVKWKKSLLLNIIIIGITSLIISLLLPKWYKSTAVVMPPQDTGAGMGLSSIMNSLPIASLGLNIGGGSEQTYIAILKSRSLAVEIIDKYNLKEFYENETLEETLINYFTDYEVLLTEENMISITYEYTDSGKVAEIVNYIVERLGELSTNLVIERAVQHKEIIEKRYFENLRAIDSLKVELELFQRKYGVIEFVEQAKAILTSIAEVESQVIIKQSEVNSIKEIFGENSPQFKNADVQLKTLKAELEKVKFNHTNDLENPFKSIFIPLDEIPTLTNIYMDIYANLLLQQKLQEFLLPEYEQAKLQLLKTQPTLQIIDVATPPDYKSKPKRALVILGMLLVSLFLHFSIILVIEKINGLKENNPAEFAKFIKLKDNLKS